MVTNPIHKATLYDAGFLPGHTEFLASMASVDLAVNDDACQ